MPDGAVLVQDLLAKGELRQSFVMSKSAQSWTFLTLSPDGAVTSEDAAGCRLCHDQATSDHVFGPPRGVESEASSPPQPASIAEPLRGKAPNSTP